MMWFGPNWQWDRSHLCADEKVKIFWLSVLPSKHIYRARIPVRTIAQDKISSSRCSAQVPFCSNQTVPRPRRVTVKASASGTGDPVVNSRCDRIFLHSKCFQTTPRPLAIGVTNHTKRTRQKIAAHRSRSHGWSTGSQETPQAGNRAWKPSVRSWTNHAIYNN